MLAQIRADRVGAIAGAHHDRRRQARLAGKAACGQTGEQFRPIACFFLDCRLDRTERDEIAGRDQHEQVNTRAGAQGASRGKAQGARSLGRFVHDDEIDPVCRAHFSVSHVKDPFRIAYRVMT